MVALCGPFLRAQPHLPFLALAGLLAVGLTGPARAFWACCLGSQLGLIFLLAANSGVLHGLAAVWPRRILVLEFLCVGAVASAVHGGHRLRHILTVLLAVGSAVQLAQTLRWAATPFTGNGLGRTYVLPYTQTPNADGSYLDSMASPLLTDWFREMATRLAAGRRVLLFYNLSSWDENATDPAGILDRLYLHLGPGRFDQQVYVFGQDSVRWGTLPIRPLTDLPAFARGLDDLDEVDGYWVEHDLDRRLEWEFARRHHEDMQQMFAALTERFELEWETPLRDAAHLLLRFHLRERGTAP